MSGKRLLRWTARGVLVAILVLWTAFLRPQALGGPAVYMVVRGDSMEPTYHSGDLLLITTQPAYSVGDPVAYHVPQGEPGAGMLVVHRIAGLAPDGGYVMRGDNNPADDPWQPDSKLIAGRVVLALPKVGQLIGYALQPVTAGALAAAVMVMTIVGRPGPSRPGQRSDSIWARLRRWRAPEAA